MMLTVKEIPQPCILGSSTEEALKFYDKTMGTSHYQTKSPCEFVGEPLYDPIINRIGGEKTC